MSTWLVFSNQLFDAKNQDMMKALFQLAVLFFLMGSCAVQIKTLVSKDELRRENYKEVKGLDATLDSAGVEPDRCPMYPGGLEGLMADVNNKVQYPEEERQNGIEGKVIVRYTIEMDGSLTSISIEKSISKGLDDEAIRVIKSLKKWYPGFLGRRPVRVEFSQPFDFKLE